MHNNYFGDMAKLPVFDPPEDPLDAIFPRLVLSRPAIKKLMKRRDIPTITELAYHTGLSYFGLVRAMSGNGFNHKTLSRLAMVLRPENVDDILRWRKT